MRLHVPGVETGCLVLVFSSQCTQQTRPEFSLASFAVCIGARKLTPGSRSLYLEQVNAFLLDSYHNDIFRN